MKIMFYKIMYIFFSFLQNTNFWANVWQKKLFYYYIENVFQIWKQGPSTITKGFL
jgi:hypothetical protein